MAYGICCFGMFVFNHNEEELLSCQWHNNFVVIWDFTADCKVSALWTRTAGKFACVLYLIRVLCYAFEFTMACWIYENYGLHFLNWDSIWTWIIAFILVDFTYYWFHRGAHGKHETSFCSKNCSLNFHLKK